MKRSIRRPLAVVALSVLVTVPLHVERPPAASATGGATIQSLVEGASAGGTVVVPPGTYVEDLAIGKALTLQCANAGISAGASPGTRGPETTIQGQAVVTASGVIIDGCRFVRPTGFTVDQVPNLVASSGVSAEVVVRNSIFDLTVAGSDPEVRGCGAAISGTAAWRVKDSLFRNHRGTFIAGSDPCGGSDGSRVIYINNGQPVVVEGNRFDGVAHVFMKGSGPNGSQVLNNLFTGSNPSVTLGNVSDVVVRGNTFQTSNGVYTDSATDLIVENNLLAENSSYLLYADTGSSTLAPSGVVVRNNAILGKYGSSVGAPFAGFNTFNLSPNPLDVRNNWWDVTTAEEIGTLISAGAGAGAVAFEPFLLSGVSFANPSGYPTGFWPTPPASLTEESAAQGPSFLTNADGSVPTATPGSASIVTSNGLPVVPDVSFGSDSGLGSQAVQISAPGLSVAVTGDLGANPSSGVIASSGGEIAARVHADIPAGAVVEVWLFSTPRLVAAARATVDGQVDVTVPLATPLDGGGPVEPGVHTLQLLIPTSNGVIGVNVGVTVGGPVPTSVPAGSSPSVPLWLLSIALLGVLLLGGDLIRRTTKPIRFA
jgi:nitrous oxidase accessory protein NosD